MNNQYRVVDRFTSEWSSMWASLAGHPMNCKNTKPTSCPNKGELWAYTGTVVKEDRDIHMFRHANHPIEGEITLNVISSN